MQKFTLKFKFYISNHCVLLDKRKKISKTSSRVKQPLLNFAQFFSLLWHVLHNWRFITCWGLGLCGQTEKTWALSPAPKKIEQTQWRCQFFWEDGSNQMVIFLVLNEFMLEQLFNLAVHKLYHSVWSYLGYGDFSSD